MTAASDDHPVSIVWKAQRRHLWTGRLLGRPAGTIEQGHRFTFTGLDGVRRSGFTSLRFAQAAAERLRPGDPAPSSGPRRRFHSATIVAGSAVALLTGTFVAVLGTVLR